MRLVNEDWRYGRLDSLRDGSTNSIQSLVQGWIRFDSGNHHLSVFHEQLRLQGPKQFWAGCFDSIMADEAHRGLRNKDIGCLEAFRVHVEELKFEMTILGL